MDVTLQEHGPQEMYAYKFLKRMKSWEPTSVVETEYVRVVQRYSYTVEVGGYDFSRVAEGATRMEAKIINVWATSLRN